MAGFSVVGYDVAELLGFGTSGEVWSARARASGRAVALRRLRVPDGQRDRVRAAAAPLAAVEHPHLVRVHDLVTTDDSLVLVLDRVAGGSLTRLLERRGRLPAGEVVTLLVPLAQALGTVHDHGVTHGRVTPSAVLLGADGRPLLGDLGLAALLRASDGSDIRAPCTAADDVHGLAVTCWTALVGTAPYDGAGVRVGAGPLDAAGARVAAALEPALSADPERRPSVADLAERVFAAAPAVPLRLAGHPVPQSAAGEQVQPATATRSGRAKSHRAPGHAPGHGRRSAGWRGWAAVLLGGAAITMAALSGLAWAGADAGEPAADVGRRPRTVAAPSSTPEAWSAVLQQLDRQRADAFAAASLERLRAVYAERSPAFARDRARLTDLATAGVRASGLRLRATDVTARDATASRVVLRVVDELGPYQLREPDGTLVERRAGRGASTWSVTLVRERGVWRVYDVVAS
ncbi:MAG: eukaryotic-like serine/threonine-protein kinase [Actinomycetota bacterium]|jgi:hypothetical protein|nr:eukaryotic-like serine/threonine-protein kinase [Actinomycetota bacterium]